MKGRPYLTITQNSLMTSLTYRGHFYFTLIGTAIYLIMSYFLWKAVYANGGTIGGLSLAQAYFYVGISISLAGLLRTATDWHVYNIVSSGDILRFLTKPLNFSRQLLAEAIGEGLMNCVIIALPAFTIVGFLSGIPFPHPARILIFIPAVVMAFLLNFYFDFLTGLTVFRTQAIGGITTAKESTVMVLSGACQNRA